MLKDLSASGYVLDPTGKKVKASSLGFGAKFREGKKDPFLFVQKKSGFGGRLSTSGETGEIKTYFKPKQTKKKKKKKKFSLWDF